MSIELNRAAFEAFAQSNEFGAYRIGRKGDGYDSSHTQLMWMSWCAAIQQAEAQQPSTPEPVAHLWQHDETGRTRIVMSGDVWTANDRWYYIGPLVLGGTNPAPSEPDDVVRLRNALILAGNRLERLTLELKYDSQARADAIEWASDAMLAAKDSK